MKTRFLSLFLAAVLLLGIIPGTVLANEEALWTDRDVFDFESDLADSPWTLATNSALTADKAYTGTQSLKVGNGETVKHSIGLSSNLLKAGWYRIIGYVYLNGAEPSQVSVKVWLKTADGNVATSYALNHEDVRLGDTDANGWTSFEFYFQHVADMNSYSFHLINSSSAAVYFDEVKYSKFNGEGMPYSMDASLTLNDSFAINFKIDASLIDTPTSVKYFDGDTLLETADLTGITANASGKYVFSCTGIAPHKMDVPVTAKVYAGEEVLVTGTASVVDLCNAYLKSDVNELAVLAMEVLDYGAAAQKYLDTSATDLVNSHIATSYKDIWTQSAGLIFDYEDDRVIGTEDDNIWAAVGLYLEDRISIRYTFNAESVEGLTAKVTCGDQVWNISDFEEAGEGKYKFYFDGLNPAQMRDSVVVTIMSGEAVVGNSLTYSIESYVAEKFKGDDKALKTLLQEMLYYGDAAADYVVIAKAEAEAALWSEVLSLPVTAETAIGSGAFSQQTATVSVDTTTGHTDNASIKVTSSGRLKVTTGVTRTAGWYRFSGYVKLGTANPSAMGITSWPSVSGSAPVFSSTNTDYPLFVGEPDKNGWSYFYFDRYHAVTDIFQLIINATGAVAYYDDIKYEKYLGEGQPPVLETEEETPEWEAMLSDDFETNLGNYSLLDGNNSVSVVEDTTRAGSTQVMQLDALTRAQVANTSFTSDKAGYYKLSGYVKLGLNVSADKFLYIWIYAHEDDGTTELNAVNYKFEDCLVGQQDAEGWQYFEVIYQRTQSVSNIQYRIGNTSDLTQPIWFDNLQYSRFVGAEAPAKLTPTAETQQNT